ncbi:TPA: DNA recombination protein RmuC [Yersinia enterocolitica]|uniref:DNA recombination protein RmuC n=2 Tax=Gammaproteobacteria TaxID=1236 RepID=UPI000744383D|nr:DNA recombination protein RmuC [Lelliottia amnigena]ELZ1905775.1 DNA recombination protein RmuC [Yersinia enterocolitica]PEG63228.1 DNA recombination protein RmuC [Lelliottia amnigena]
MFSVEWNLGTLIFLIFLALLCCGIGYLFSLTRQGRKVAQLSLQIEQNLQALSVSNATISEQTSLLDDRQKSLHQYELSESKIQDKLNGALSTEKRLLSELAEYKSNLISLGQQLTDNRQKQHEAEMQSETCLADIRSLKSQETELRERLSHMEKSLEQERATTNGLKELLAEEGKKTKAVESTNNETREQLRELKEQLSNAANKYDTLQGNYGELQSQYTKLETAQQEREASHNREVASFETQKASLVEQFKVLSGEILETKTKSLQESSKSTLSALMNPFQQSIDSFKKEVQEIHHRETTQQGELRKELESLKELNQKITTEAHELSTALRGQKKLQGNWGEMILENVLERSGLLLDKDYKREVSINTEEGRQRPDAIIYLPQGKHLIIDAKVSLNAYTRYINAEDDAERSLALKEHVSAIGGRIRELADRDYYKLPGLNSPEIVFMFVPIESAFVEALKADETLFQQAIEKNVLVATPTTLLTSLNIVRQLWRYEDQNKHTAALANKAETVFKKLNSFLGSFEKIKKGLDTANSAYIAAEGQLVSGKGNLIKQVGEFKNLAPAIKAELPSYFADKASLEIDFIPMEFDDHNDKEAVLSVSP